MKSFINNNPAFIFILTIYALISIFLVGFHDYSSDSSLYSVRALGWTDYMGSSQKGPVQWLDHSTWWSSLSFQDAPPVVFGMQYIFFRLFGGATSSAQILFLLAGVILLCSVYFYVQKIKDTETAVWSSVAFGVSSLALWSTTSGNLEGVQSLFIILNFLTTLLYIKYNKDKYLYFAIVFMGLALMSKYTSIFIIPSFLASLYIWKSRQEKSSAERDIKISKYFYSTLLLFIIILPTFFKVCPPLL